MHCVALLAASMNTMTIVPPQGRVVSNTVSVTLPTLSLSRHLRSCIHSHPLPPSPSSLLPHSSLSLPHPLLPGSLPFKLSVPSLCPSSGGYFKREGKPKDNEVRASPRAQSAGNKAAQLQRCTGDGSRLRISCPVRCAVVTMQASSSKIVLSSTRIGTEAHGRSLNAWCLAVTPRCREGEAVPSARSTADGVERHRDCKTEQSASS